MKQQKIVITGGPGTGKSSIIDQLSELEFTCMPEISRSVIREAQKTGIDQLFLNDPLLFSKLLLKGRIAQYKKADSQQADKVFFDRGIPDIHGYLDFIGSEYPKLFIQKSMEFRYSKVFMMPPWKEIYKTDSERYESYEQSKKIYTFLMEGYTKMKYPIIEVPAGNIAERVNFILKSI